MDNKYPFKKGKGIFVYDIHSNRYYDFENNLNILGHSNKKLTATVKNHISSSWNLFGDTIYHRKIKQLHNRNFPNYYLTNTFSLIEFFNNLLNFANSKSFKIVSTGDRFNLWIQEYCNYKNIGTKNSAKIIIHDMAEKFLKTGEDYANLLKNIRKEKITILNYYWFPYLEIDTCNADIIILPQIYNGNFKYLNILINKQFTNANLFVNKLATIPSLYLASSLKLYYMIKKANKEKPLKLNWKNFAQKERLFTYDTKSTIEYKKILNEYLNKNIILNPNPPYYNYLPIKLEDYQKKYLSKIRI